MKNIENCITMNQQVNQTKSLTKKSKVTKKNTNIKIYDRDMTDNSYMSYNWLFECGCDEHYY
jgi:hypothetical protein